MMRRRAFFGGVRQLFIFKEGEGLDASAFIAKTFGQSTSVAAQKISVRYSASDQQPGRISIEKRTGTNTGSKINWATDFPNYHTLFIECYRSNTNGLRKCGLSTMELPNTSDEYWLESRLPANRARETVSFALDGKAASYISAIGGDTSNAYGEIYNIWLE